MKLILFIIIALCICSTTHSQNQVTVHVTGGYDLPLADFKGTFPADSAKSPHPYFMKSGFNAGTDVSYYLGKKKKCWYYLIYRIPWFYNW